MAETHRDTSSLKFVPAEVVRRLNGIELPADGDPAWTTVAPARRLFWSYVFPLERRSAAETEEFFAKIPVATFKKAPLLPLTEADRAAGRAEWNSLNRLRAGWPDPPSGIRIVEPFRFVEDMNVIVLRRVEGVHLHELMRADDCRSRILGRKRSPKLTGLIEALGVDLARFHDRTLAEGVFPAEPYKAKLERYVEELRSFGTSVRFEPFIGRLDSRADAVTECRVATTLKGLEIGNILVACDGAAHLFDPGPAKVDVPEADLARLVVGCRILYWGTICFALLDGPAPHYADRLLAAYHSVRKTDHRVYELCLAKEILKIWRMCHRALAEKPWPATVKRLAARQYVDRFFARSIEG